MRRFAFAVLCALPIGLMAPAAEAALTVTIDKTSQRLSVSVDGVPRYDWATSTGRNGYGTPNGTYRPQWLARSYFSKKYYNAPMPYAIFFHGGYAIHGTTEINRLGGPASHGCVRLHPSHAATLFALVQQHGRSETRIVITGATAVASRRPGQRYAKTTRRAADSDAAFYDDGDQGSQSFFGFAPRHYGAPAYERPIRPYQPYAYGPPRRAFFPSFGDDD